MHKELRWAVFGILIPHVYDCKPRVTMESIKNVAVSDLAPSFFLFNFFSFHLSACVTILLHVSMHLQCEAIYDEATQSVQEIFMCCHFTNYQGMGLSNFFRKLSCVQCTYHFNQVWGFLGNISCT